MHLQPLIDWHLEQAATATTAAKRIEQQIADGDSIPPSMAQRWIDRHHDAAGIHLATVNHLLGVGEQP